MKEKRKVEIVVISDTHLGTQGCRAEELHRYLQSIKPSTLVLNGDIIDIWQFKKKYFPKSHLKVVKRILDLASKRTKTYYISGNHDEMLRKFEGVKIGKLKFVNQLELEVDGKRMWFFHGDVFDVIMQYSPWISKLGAIGYDTLIALNTLLNKATRVFGRKPISFSKKIKDSVKSAVTFINSFEDTAIAHGVKRGVDTVVCGHIHKAERRVIVSNEKQITYLNSGDWVENLTALEYQDGEWTVFQYNNYFNDNLPSIEDDKQLVDCDTKELFQLLIKDFEHPTHPQHNMVC